MDGGGSDLSGGPNKGRGTAAGAAGAKSAPARSLFDRAEAADGSLLAPLLAVGGASVLLAFSSATLSLDAVKLPLFVVFGGVLTVAALLVARREWTSDQRAMLAWFGVAVVSAFAARHHWVAGHEMARRLAALGFFLGAARVASHPRGARVMVSLLLVLLASQLAFSLFHQAGGFVWLIGAAGIDPAARSLSTTAQMIITFAGASDLMGTILNIDFFSGYIVAMAPIAFGGMLLARRRWERWACFGLGLLCVQTLLVTLSKESLVAMVVSLGAMAAAGWWIASRRAGDQSGTDARPSRSRALLIIATIAIIVGGMVFAATSPRARSAIASLPESFHSRGIIWRGALSIWAEDPLLGAGPGNFRIAFPPHRDPDHFEHGVSNVTLYAHSHYLDALSETGLLGAAAMGAFLLLWFGAGLSAALGRSHRDSLTPSSVDDDNDQARANDDTGPRLLALAFVASGIAMAVQDLSSPWSRWAVGMMIQPMVWGVGSGIFAGILARRRAAHDREPAHESQFAVRLRRGAAIAAALCAVAGAFMSLREFRALVAYHQGYQAYADRDPAKAVEWFRRSIAIDPHQPSALYWMGGTLLDGGRTSTASAPTDGSDSDDAVELLNAALEAYDLLEEIWPLYSETAYNRSLAEDDLATHSLSVALARMQERDADGAAVAMLETLRHFQRATEAARTFRRMSERIVAVRQLADVQRRQGRFLARFGHLLPGEPSATPLFEAALAEYRAALALPVSPNEAQDEARSLERRQQMRRHVHDLLVELGRPDEAVAVAREAYAASPDDDDDAMRLIDLLLHELDRPAEAAAAADDTLADQPISPTRLALAVQAHYLAGNDARAAELLARLRRVLDRADDAALERAYWEPLAELRAALGAR